MTAIHLIRKNDPTLPQIEIVDRTEGIWKSGHWYLPEDKARGLIGKRIYFHRLQSEPSFFGGTILDVEVTQHGKYKGRIAFIFRYDKACRDCKTPKAGWSQEMKIT